MYKNFDLCISCFSDDNNPGDYWYDYAIVEATEILNQFNESDWTSLVDSLDNKSIFWKMRLVECLGDLNNTYELTIILALIEINDNELIVSCIDALRTINIDSLSENEFEKINDRLSFIHKNSSLIGLCIVEDFKRKFIDK
ncbi:hypothetical protein ACM92P_003339 [Cronobacter dublinensis]